MPRLREPDATVLLDTNALFWLITASPQLGQAARALIEAALRADRAFVSVMSFWELATLVRRERIVLDRPVDLWRLAVLSQGLKELPLDGASAVEAGSLVWAHGDPADRLILAQALTLGATLVTSDRKLLDWPGRLERVDARS